MKATLHFEHEEQDELQDAINGFKWRLIVWELDQDLRGIVKHGYIGNREATSAEIKMADYVRTKLRQLVSDDGLNLEA
jgi:hypothetical protein